MGLSSHVNKAANSFKIPDEPMGTKVKFNDDSENTVIKKKVNNKMKAKKENVKKIRNEKKVNKVNKLKAKAEAEKKAKKVKKVMKNKTKAPKLTAKKVKTVKLPSKKCKFSICIGTSIISNCNNLEQITNVLYQVAKSCLIYNVNELVILNDNLEEKPFKESQGKKANKSVIMSTILQYFITPEYLIKSTFKKEYTNLLKYCMKLPKISTLPFNKLINQGDIEVKKDMLNMYREGISVTMKHPNQNKSGKKYEQTKYIQIGESELLELSNQLIPTNVRVTVNKKTREIVTPEEAYGVNNLNIHKDNIGYTIRIVDSIENLYLGCTKKEGYDQSIFINCGDIHSKSFGDRILRNNFEKVTTGEDPLRKGIKVKDVENPSQILVVFNSIYNLDNLFKVKDISLQQQIGNVLEIFDNEIPLSSHVINVEDAIMITLTKFDV